MFDKMSWLNEPKSWRIQSDVLHVETGNETDFWRKTFYGFTRDSGHFMYLEVDGDFTAEVILLGDYSTLYDQSGLMIRVDEKNWIKAGIEFTDGFVHVGAVLTREYSDWSVVKLKEYNGSLKIRITRHEKALRVQYLDDNSVWQLLRLGHLEMSETCQVGVMCCSPQREGFKTSFKDFVVKEPISRELHG